MWSALVAIQDGCLLLSQLGSEAGALGGCGQEAPGPQSGDTEQNRLALRAVHVWQCWDPDGTPEAARAES